MKRNTEHLNKRILEFIEDLEIDLEINEMELRDKVLRAPGLKAKWIQIYYEELDYKEKLEEARDKIKEKYLSKYGEDPSQPKFMINQKISDNADVKKIEKALKEQEKVVRYLNDINRNIWSGFGFEIKNILEILKLENM